MIAALRQMLRPRREAPPPPLPAIPPGERVYAVGDVHGRLDLFTALIAAIEADDARREAARTTLILLGDLVDRGPDSAGVVAAARALAARRAVRAVAGNHEEMLLEGLEKTEVLREFLRHGGRETVLSYGMDRAAYDVATVSEVQAALRALMPREDRNFLSAFEDQIVIGGYLFVHAGIHPGVALGDQVAEHLRWIREPFLSHGDSHGPMIVHGHTISDTVQHRTNRIGIDTGAYCLGPLTALGLEGTARWLIAADDGSAAREERMARGHEGGLYGPISVTTEMVRAAQ